MEGLFSPFHVLTFIVGGLCFALVVLCIVLPMVFFIMRRRSKDDKILVALKEENDRLREEIEQMNRGAYSSGRIMHENDITWLRRVSYEIGLELRTKGANCDHARREAIRRNRGPRVVRRGGLTVGHFSGILPNDRKTTTGAIDSAFRTEASASIQGQWSAGKKRKSCAEQEGSCGRPRCRMKRKFLDIIRPRIPTF